MKECKIVGCVAVVKCNGYCNKHHLRWLRNGHPLLTKYDYREREKRYCSVDGCEDSVYAKGFCNRHYQRFRNYGTWTTEGFKTDSHLSVKERLEKNKIVTEKDCHEWTKHKDKNGYGIMSIKNRPVRVHRVSYETYVKPIPKGLLVLHKCDNPSCFNPEHLYVGTNCDNINDMLDRGRTLKGTSNHNAKLTEEQVKEIKTRYANGETPNEIYHDYPVSGKCLRNIRDGKSWKHVTI